MIRILLNGNEVIKFHGNMDLRLGKPVTILGTKYVIQKIRSTVDFVEVIIEEEKTNTTTLNHVTKVQSGRNPFLR